MGDPGQNGEKNNGLGPFCAVLWGTMSGDWGQVLTRPKALFTAAFRQGTPALAILLACIFLPPLASNALAGDTLSATGTRLSPVVMPAGVADLRRTVDLGADQPTATYVTARTLGGALLKRTRNGYWLPWSGREEDLADNGFTAADGKLEFKLLKEAVPAAQLPMTITIGYRTAAGLKYGLFEITAQ